MRAQPIALALTALLAFSAAGARASTISILNADPAGIGFNDPTPAAPVGGNPGTTVGQQRLIAIQFAASLWGALLDSAQPIVAFTTWEPLGCSPTAATLATAGATQVWRDFSGSEFPDTWYHVALAERRSFTDLSEGVPEIRARFNINLGIGTCFTGGGWYYGLDNHHGTRTDLVNTALHELGHGLGFANFVDEGTGANFLGRNDIYSVFTFDRRQGKSWGSMTNAERAASAVNYRQVSFAGPASIAAAPLFLALGTPALTVTSPSSVATAYGVGLAQFGPALSSPGVTGQLALGLNASSTTGLPTSDACTPLTNAAAVAGKIALVDRGGCDFFVKVKNSQNAGAIAVIIADNVAVTPPGGLGGTDPTITIPSARVILPDGNRLKAALAGGPVTGTLGINPVLRNGTDLEGRPLVNAQIPVSSGSSISHWDPAASPNLLMEPSINLDLTGGPDLTLPQMRDIGWDPDTDLDAFTDDVDQCDHSVLTAIVVIEGCDSGVPNPLFGTGCTITDNVLACAVGARNHGGFVSCVSHYLNDLKKDGVISGEQKGNIQSCAAGSGLP